MPVTPAAAAPVAFPPIETHAGPEGLHAPFGPEKTAEVLDVFYREGFALLPGVFSRDECAVIRDEIDRALADPAFVQNRYTPFVMTRMFEAGTMFRDLLVREPIIGLAEAILGPSCHLMAQNVIRNAPGQAITRFHADVDEECGLEFPCPPEMPRHDPRYRLPVLRMTVQIMLSDCDALEYGPTQFVPGSHYSGRHPNNPDTPTFEGRGPLTIFCKAGAVYLHNGQCWHRGAPNTSDRTRYLFQNSYCQRWIAQKFFPFIDYRMPEHVWEGAGERLQRVLGRHPKGAYG